eukprot:929246_1
MQVPRYGNNAVASTTLPNGNVPYHQPNGHVPYQAYPSAPNGNGPVQYQAAAPMTSSAPAHPPMAPMTNSALAHPQMAHVSVQSAPMMNASPVPHGHHVMSPVMNPPGNSFAPAPVMTPAPVMQYPRKKVVVPRKSRTRKGGKSRGSGRAKIQDQSVVMLPHPEVHMYLVIM